MPKRARRLIDTTGIDREKPDDLQKADIANDRNNRYSFTPFQGA